MNGDGGSWDSVVVQVVCMGISSHLHQSQPVFARLPGSRHVTHLSFSLYGVSLSLYLLLYLSFSLRCFLFLSKALRTGVPYVLGSRVRQLPRVPAAAAAAASNTKYNTGGMWDTYA